MSSMQEFQFLDLSHLEENDHQNLLSLLRVNEKNDIFVTSDSTESQDKHDDDDASVVVGAEEVKEFEEKDFISLPSKNHGASDISFFIDGGTVEDIDPGMVPPMVSTSDVSVEDESVCGEEQLFIYDSNSVTPQPSYVTQSPVMPQNIQNLANSEVPVYGMPPPPSNYPPQSVPAGQIQYSHLTPSHIYVENCHVNLSHYGIPQQSSTIYVSPHAQYQNQQQSVYHPYIMPDQPGMDAPLKHSYEKVEYDHTKRYEYHPRGGSYRGRPRGGGRGNGGRRRRDEPERSNSVSSDHSTYSDSGAKVSYKENTFPPTVSYHPSYQYSYSYTGPYFFNSITRSPMPHIHHQYPHDPYSGHQPMMPYPSQTSVPVSQMPHEITENIPPTPTDYDHYHIQHSDLTVPTNTHQAMMQSNNNQSGYIVTSPANRKPLDSCYYTDEDESLKYPYQGVAPTVASDVRGHIPADRDFTKQRSYYSNSNKVENKIEKGKIEELDDREIDQPLVKCAPSPISQTGGTYLENNDKIIVKEVTEGRDNESHNSTLSKLSDSFQKADLEDVTFGRQDGKLVEATKGKDDEAFKTEKQSNIEVNVATETGSSHKIIQFDDSKDSSLILDLVESSDEVATQVVHQENTVAVKCDQNTKKTTSDSMKDLNLSPELDASNSLQQKSSDVIINSPTPKGKPLVNQAPPVVDNPKEPVSQVSLQNTSSSKDDTAVEINTKSISKAPVKETVWEQKKSWSQLFKPNDDMSCKQIAYVSPFNSKESNKGKVEDAKTNGTISLSDIEAEKSKVGELLKQYIPNYRPVQLQPRGLINKNYWCYANAPLQALLACPSFYQLMRNLSKEAGSRSGNTVTPFINSVVDFVNEFLPMTHSVKLNGKEKGGSSKKEPEVATGNPFEPTCVYKMLVDCKENQFTEGRQQDAEEMLSCILNGLHDEMVEAVKLTGGSKEVDAEGEVATQQDENEWKVQGPRKKSCITRAAHFASSPISQIFWGQLRSVLQQGGKITANLQPFNSLPLDIQSPKVDTLKEALGQLVMKEEISGFTCSKTNQEVPASNHVMLEALPRVLILQLKRFIYDKDGGLQKVTKRMQFPVDLELTKELISTSSRQEYSGSRRKYKLFAVVNHEGKEATKGHYVADVYHVGYNCWLRYDDSNVTSIPEAVVLKHDPPRVPYLLFYRRSDTLSSSASSNSIGSSCNINVKS